MKDRKKRKLHLRKRTKQLIALFCVLFVSISAGLTISSVKKNSLVSNKAYLNRFNVSEKAENDHEAVTDINGETPNEFAAKVKEANLADTGSESKVIVNAPLGDEEKLADMVKDKNAVSYDSYTVVRFSDDDNDKSLFINNMKAEKFDYQDDGMVQIAGIGGYAVPSYDKDMALPVSDTPAKDAHDQGKLLVAVIDTGCGTEADSSINFTADSDMDNNGHGSAMARIIKEKSDGKAYILILKAIGDNGEGTISNVTAAVKYAIEQGADIINMSIIAKDSDNMAAFKSVVEDATARSIKVVAAAGNFSDDVSNYVPANVTGVISVGAVTEDGMIADFSNYGKDLTMSVKGAGSTSEAAAVVSGYLSGNKQLGSQKNVVGNYKENPKNEGHDEPETDKHKFVTQWRDGRLSTPDETDPETAKPVKKARMLAASYANLTGNAYAVFNSSTGELDFIRSTENHTDGSSGTVKSISGGTYTGTIFAGTGTTYTGFETSTWTMYSPFQKIAASVKTVKFIDAVRPKTCFRWFAGMANCTNMVLDKLDTSNVTNMGGMFFGCKSLTSLDVSKFNTANVTNMSDMFYNCNKLTFLDVSRFNTANVTEMDAMFNSCFKLTSLDVSKFNTAKVTDMMDMFFSCSSLTSLDLSGFNTSNVTHMNWMFAWCGSLTSLNVSGFNTANVTNMNGMFANCNKLTSLDVSGFNTAKVKDMKSVFDASSLAKITFGQEFKVPSSHRDMFASPTVTFSGKTSDGTWGLGSETASSSKTAKELANYGTTAGNLTGTWYAQKKIESPVDVNSIYVARGTDANGNPTSKEVYAYNLQHNPMKYVEGKSNLGNPETNGMITPDVVQKNRPYEKELGTFDVQIGKYKFNGVADFAGYYPYGDTLTLSNPKLPDGYQFLGYDIYSGGKKVQSVTSDTVTAAVGNGELDPYIRVQGVAYNVSFNSNAAGTAGTPNDPQTEMPSGTMKPQTMHYGQLESIEKCGFTWAGHKFLGWSTNPKATKPDTLNVYTVEQPPAKQQNQKAQDAAKDVQLTDGATAFWDYFGKDLGDYAHKDGATITLYAVWEPVERTLKVDPNGGTWNNSKSTQTFTENWGTTKDLGIPTAPAYTATVSFDLNFDPTDPNKEENEGKPYSPTPSSVTLKYVFKNWTVNSGGEGYMEGNVYTFQSTNDTVTANYYFQNLTLPTVTREGYTFLGWYREEGGLHKAGNAGYTEYRPEKNETLYARWRKDTYTYKDTIEVTDTDTKDSNPDRALLIRKTDTYGTVLTQKGFTIGIYKQNLLGGLGDKVYELRTGEGLYKADGTLVDDTADANGYYELKDPAAGKYVAHEEEAPAGWYMADDYKFVVAGTSGERVTVELEDSKIVKPPHDNPVKKDSYGRALTQAVFELKDNTTNKVIGSYSIKRNNITKRTDFPTEMYESLQAGHSYTLTETNPPDGFETATYSFDVPRTGTDGLKDISILDQAKTTGQLQIKKVDSTDKPLKGAEFQLFMKDETGTLVPCMMDKASGKWTNAAKSDTVVPMKGTTDDGGTITWMNLPLRASFTGSEPDFCKSYYLVETKAPEGYSLTNKVIEIRLDDNAKDKTVTYTVKDGRVTVTLDAGGNGIAWYAGIGVTVMMAALLLAVRAKRKQAE